MGRPLRSLKRDAIYHVFNRSAGKRRIFQSDEDYAVFGETLKDVQTKVPMRVLAFCFMPNHWHLVVWPFEKYSLSDFMHRVTTKHAKQHNVANGIEGCGHVYQERFRAVEVEDERQLIVVLRYVEANARTAGLVSCAQDWKWSSACAARDCLRTPPIDQWPIPRPRDWFELLNQFQPEDPAAE
jgi:putative transposase